MTGYYPSASRSISGTVYDDTGDLNRDLTYRVGRPLLRQTLGYSDKEIRALASYLSQQGTPTPARLEDIEIAGLDLNTTQLKALYSLLYLMDQQGYENMSTRVQNIPDYYYNPRQRLPVLRIRPSEYIRAYTLADGIDHLAGKKRQGAWKALKSLRENFSCWISYPYYNTSGERKYFARSITRPLIFWDPEFHEQDTDPTRGPEEDLIDRITILVIEAAHPLLIAGVNSGDYMNWVSSELNLYDLLGKVSGKTRLPMSMPLFIHYLLNLNVSPITVSRDWLARELRLHYYIENRKQTEIKRQIKEAAKAAIELDYLLKYSYDKKKDMYTLWPGPRCRAHQKAIEAGGKD